MKRALCALLLTLVCASAMCGEALPLRGWDQKEGYVYVALGRWPQTAEGDKEPIVWRVLTVEDGAAYLLSEYVLLAHPMHEDYQEYARIGGDFSQTDLCRYLNEDFAAEAFAPGELALLKALEPYGKVFVPDSADVKNERYGLGNVKLNADPTPYARKTRGANGEKDKAHWYWDTGHTHGPYWLRNQSTTNRQAARATKANGTVGYINSAYTDIGVRPAVLLKLDGLAAEGGEGTLESPFTLAVRAE